MGEVLLNPSLGASMDLAQAAGDAALQRVNDFESSSSLSRSNGEENLWHLGWDDLEIGPLVGTGAFSSVFAVTLRSIDKNSTHLSMGNPKHQRGERLESFLSFSDDEQDSDNEQDQDSQEEEKQVDKPVMNTLSQISQRQYALKCLDPNLSADAKNFTSAAVDLALEAQLLARLSHPHIIQLHGITAGCVSHSFSENDGGFFIILDLMLDTLDEKLKVWTNWHSPSKKGLLNRLRPSSVSNRAVVAAQLDRLEHVALGVARGLEYLHQNSILYRDIKPENIGFDKDNNVRIFDFGLAREVTREVRETGMELRQLTGEAGTPRYMSPEMAKREGFDFSSDVYSFALLVWEICALEKPFDNIKSRALFEHKVVYGGHRPSLKKIGVEELRPLLEQAWHDDPKKRPSISTFRETLDKIVEEAANQAPSQKRASWLCPRLSRDAEFHSMERRGEGDGLDAAKPRHSFLKQLSGSWRKSSQQSLIPHDSRHSTRSMEGSRRIVSRAASFDSTGSRRIVSRASSMDGSKHTLTAAEAMAETLALEAKQDMKHLRRKRFRWFRGAKPRQLGRPVTA